MVGGRYLGFPKYVVEEISIAKNGETRVAKAKYKNVAQLELEFHSGIKRQLESWEKELVESESFFKGNTHQLVPLDEVHAPRKLSFATSFHQSGRQNMAWFASELTQAHHGKVSFPMEANSQELITISLAVST